MAEYSIKSPDGTTIVYEQLGMGPPLVLVHGGFVDRSFWGPSLPLLARHFRVFAMDRRGHGSSDGYPADHHIEREYEDLEALVKTIDQSVSVLGHSSGALVVLHAALRTDLMRELVLYEPPQLGSFTPAICARLHASLATGDMDEMVATVLVDVVARGTGATFSAEERQGIVSGMRGSPVWTAALRNARSIPAEADSYASYRFDRAQFLNFTLPTFLLVGSGSAPILRAWAEELNSALPNGRIVLLEGQGHGAMVTAPDLFVRTVREILQH